MLPDCDTAFREEGTGNAALCLSNGRPFPVRRSLRETEPEDDDENWWACAEPV